MKLHSQEVAALTLWIFTHMKLWLPEHRCIHARGSHEWFISLDYTADAQTRKSTLHSPTVNDHIFGYTSLFVLDVHVYLDNHHLPDKYHILSESGTCLSVCICVYTSLMGCFVGRSKYCFMLHCYTKPWDNVPLMFSTVQMQYLWYHVQIALHYFTCSSSTNEKLTT